MVFPICCVVDIPGEFLTRVINANLEKSYCSKLEDFNLMVVDSLDKTYTRPITLPVPSTSADSPFKGKTAEECLVLLRNLSQRNQKDGVKGPDGIEPGYFILLDARSLEDETGILAVAKGEELATVRIGTSEAENLALCCSVGHAPTIEELQEEAARSADGIALGETPRNA